MSENLMQKLVVEALGAFSLCFFSIGAVVLTQGHDIVAIGLATGLAITIMVAAGGHRRDALWKGCLRSSA